MSLNFYVDEIVGKGKINQVSKPHGSEELGEGQGLNARRTAQQPPALQK